MMKESDVLIIGAGPAGLTAAIYACRAGASVTLIEKAAAGGQVNFAAELENYPGFEGVQGAVLSEKMRAQAVNCGAEIIGDEVTAIDLKNKVVTTAFSGELSAKSIIIASGTRNRALGLENEDKYIGAGISYCAVCDGGFFRNKTVVVNGGGNTAFKDALYLSKLCKKVYIVHRREGFRAESVYVERAKKTDNIEFVLNYTVTALIGEQRLTAIEVTEKLTNVKKTIETDGLFIAIGNLPESELVKNQLKTDENGYIITDECMKTSVDNVYAAGDIRQKPLKQVITAAADGATAANCAVEKIF